MPERGFLSSMSPSLRLTGTSGIETPKARVKGFEFTRDARLCSDGSCLRPTLGELARAGFGVCELDSDGNLPRAIFGPVPKLFGQSSGVGEHAASMVGAIHAEGTLPSSLAVDCRA
eukprot:3837582-Pyramimonas_sp.AAC.1